MAESAQLAQRLRSLEEHLAQENPVLLHAVASFRKLDKVARRIGFLHSDESYATRITWWPMVAVLGTYSSGKSTFINHYLQAKLQLTGNQAVDDHFTVVCFSKEGTARVLPGLALDADPRFPFYQVSRAIEEITAGEGRRIDAYLQLKTSPSEHIRGKILIDSPGFDADAQRTGTLRITNHIIDLSDLVLVFFDARHPEPGTMQDTLEHLVAQTIHRPDSNKFLYVLNQIDTTAREDNPEDVIASWERALAQQGLTAGRFYRIYNPDAAYPIEDPALRERFETKRDIDLAEIHLRMRQVEVDRAYRIITVLEQAARDIEEHIIPTLGGMQQRWRERTLRLDGILFGTALVLIAGLTLWTGEWTGWRFSHTFWSQLFHAPVWRYVALGAVVVLAGYTHFSMRKLAAKHVINRFRQQARNMREQEFVENFAQALHKSTRVGRSIFRKRPVGWGKRARKEIDAVLAEARRHVQELNDKFTDPSGASYTPPESPGTLATSPDVEPPETSESPATTESPEKLPA